MLLPCNSQGSESHQYEFLTRDSSPFPDLQKGLDPMVMMKEEKKDGGEGVSLNVEKNC